MAYSNAFHHYVQACTDSEIHTGISDGSDAYLERRIAYSKVSACLKGGRQRLLIFAWSRAYSWCDKSSAWHQSVHSRCHWTYRV